MVSEVQVDDDRVAQELLKVSIIVSISCPITPSALSGSSFVSRFFRISFFFCSFPSRFSQLFVKDHSKIFLKDPKDRFGWKLSPLVFYH